MIARTDAAGRRYTWFGFEVERIRQVPPSRRTGFNRVVEEFLRFISSAGSRSTVTLRFRQVAAGQVGAAVIVRVDGSRGEGGVPDWMSAVTQQLERLDWLVWRTLAEGDLEAWLRLPHVQPRWCARLLRQVHYGSARPISATGVEWDALLEVLGGEAPGAVVDVRIRPDDVVGGAFVAEVRARAERDAAPHYDEAAGELGFARARTSSPFSNAALHSWNDLRERDWSRAFRFELSATAVGPPSFRFRRALQLLGGDGGDPRVELREWAPSQMDDAVDAFSVLRFHDEPAISELDLLRDRVALDEAVSLFHVPRYGSSPTPGITSSRIEPANLHDLRGRYWFLSYARQDIELAEELICRLRAMGHEVWWDRRMVAGDVLDRSIGRALESAQCLGALVLVTGHTSTSRWVVDELDAARTLRKPILQVVIDSMPLVDSNMVAVPLTTSGPELLGVHRLDAELRRFC